MDRFFNGFSTSASVQRVQKATPDLVKSDSVEDFVAKGREVLRAFIDVAQEEPSPRLGWKRTKEYKGIVAYEKRRPDSAINLLRFETRVAIDADTLISFLNDPEFLQRVAPSVFTAKTILRQFDENHSILHFTFPTLGPIANRDLATFETSARHVAGFDFVTAARSIDVPSSPPAAGVVRAYVSVTGYGVIRETDTTCKLVHIVHVNPRGALIPMLVNMFQVKPPLEAVVAICAHCADYARKRAAGQLAPAEPVPETAAMTAAADVAPLAANPGADSGDSYSHLLERLMDNPSVLDQLMNLAPIKRLIKDTALLKSLMNGDKGGKLAEMFDDKTQLEDLCDMIISGELSMQELTGLLNEMFGYETEGDRTNEEKDRLKVIEASLVDADTTLQFQVLDEHELITPLGAEPEADAAQADELTNGHTTPRQDQPRRIYSDRWTARPLTVQQQNVFQASDALQVQQWCCDVRASGGEEHGSTSASELTAAQVHTMWQTLLQCHPALRTLLLRVKPVSARRRGGSGNGNGASPAPPPRASSTTTSSIYQVLPSRSLPFAFREVDWSAKSVDEQEREWAELLAADAQAGFDLRRLEHPLRVTLVRQHAGLKLLWSFHAALLDHRSAVAVLAQFIRLVRGNVDKNDDVATAVTNDEAELEPELKDDAKRVEEEKRFWRELLRDIRAPTPLYKAGPAAEPSSGQRRAVVKVVLTTEQLDGLRALAQRHRVGLETVLVAAWACLLQRCSGGEKRVLFGSLLPASAADVSNNSHQQPIGCVCAPMPTVADFDENAYPSPDMRGAGGVGVRLDAFLGRLDATVRSMRARRQPRLSLGAIQQQSEVGPEYRLFDSLFVLDDYTRGLLGSTTAAAAVSWQYPLVLLATTAAEAEAAASVELALSYDAGLWRPQDARRLATYLSTLLGSLAECPAPDAAVHALRLLPEDEVQRLVVAHNDNARSYPTDVRVEQLFAEQAARTPDRVALTFHELDQVLTYGELDRRANRVAHYLLARGLGKGSLLAIYMTRCVEVVVAIFGVLKAGAAYLPLDPDTPKERVWQIVNDASVASIITQRAKADVLFAGHAGECDALCLDDPAVVDALAGLPDCAVPVHVTAELDASQLVYVIYTSGSTGKPKGVRIRHRGLINQFQFIRARPGMAEGDVILGVSTLSFDIAQLELVLPFTCGAKVVMISSAIQRDGFRLKALLEERLAAGEPITIMQATPASWRMLCAAGWAGDAAHLRIWCGGEAMTCDLARQLLPRCAALWNMYGPTETTVWASALRVTADHVRGSSIPVGGKEDNSQFFLLDAYRQLVPTGVLGELYIAGDGVGSYVDAEMTARAFVDNPFKALVPHTSDTMFRVGDVLRYKDDDDTLEFLGRVDHQVKIRGYRIELEEIMNCLYTHAGVKECLVVARDPDYAGGEKYLVAYIILKPDLHVHDNDDDNAAREAKARVVQELRLLLEERLPAYMVPSHFMVLARWPLSPNGKVDRTALPSPTRSAQHEVGFKYATPASAEERTLVEVFESILHVSPVGIDDDFFALGGNSLLGVSLIGALEGKFGVRFPFSVIFSASTVRHLAVCVAEARRDLAATSAANGPSDKASEGDEHGGRDSCDDVSALLTKEPVSACPLDDAEACRPAAAAERLLAERMNLGRDGGNGARQLLSSLASPLVPLQTRGAGLPLFVVHPAFKSSVCYGALAHHLGPDQPVYGLEPRRDYDSIEAMAADYVAAIRRVHRSGLYNIAGWSFGCTVAYEMARQLQAANDEVNLLLLDGRAPAYDAAYLQAYDADALAFCMLCRGAKQYLGFGVDVGYDETAPLSPDGRLLHVMAKVIDGNGLELVPPSVAINFFFRFQRDIRHSELLSRAYAPSSSPSSTTSTSTSTTTSRLRGRVTLLRTTGENDIRGVDDPLLRARTLGWDQFCEDVEVVDVGGDHESMVFQPTVLEVARKLRPCLAGKSP